MLWFHNYCYLCDLIKHAVQSKEPPRQELFVYSNACVHKHTHASCTVGLVQLISKARVPNGAYYWIRHIKL